ncbi:hypothetical protein [uncultured Cardiobacterium sp.]|uniref:hypothetical protein n=1 Tax=uncultured Cardiobacterium sp. TaxID=417619 RepID=UPI002633328C|nr:hypothetical protein [uncultured Cardiobacterium sp.]
MYLPDTDIISETRRPERIDANVAKWLNKTNFANRILPIDAATAAICARLHIPDPAPENNAWIAATAIQHGLIPLTRHTGDFSATGMRLSNPSLP